MNTKVLLAPLILIVVVCVFTITDYRIFGERIEFDLNSTNTRSDSFIFGVKYCSAYSESELTRYAQSLGVPINRDNVDWVVVYTQKKLFSARNYKYGELPSVCRKLYHTLSISSLNESSQREVVVYFFELLREEGNPDEIEKYVDEL